MDELVIENEKLIFYTLKKLHLYHLLDEYYDVGMIGLVKASKNYTIEKGKFSTYACKCISNEIKQEVRKQNMLKRTASTVSIHSVIYSNGDNEITLEDTIESDINVENEAIEHDQFRIMYKAINKLPDGEQKLIKQYYGLGIEKLTQNQIAKDTNLSQAQINRNIKKIINKLRKEVEGC